MASELTEDELHILMHATAWDRGKRKRLYRNYFAASFGSDDLGACRKLCRDGMMSVTADHGDMTFFSVTEAGIRAIKIHELETQLAELKAADQP